MSDLPDDADWPITREAFRAFIHAFNLQRAQLAATERALDQCYTLIGSTALALRSSEVDKDKLSDIARERMAQLAAAEQRAKLWEDDARIAKANWDAACHDLATIRQETIEQCARLCDEYEKAIMPPPNELKPKSVAWGCASAIRQLATSERTDRGSLTAQLAAAEQRIATFNQLTDEQIVAIRDEHLPSQGEPFDCIAFARAVLAATATSGAVSTTNRPPVDDDQ